MNEIEDYLQTGIACINAITSGYELIGKDVDKLKQALNIYFSNLDYEEEIDYESEFKVGTNIRDYFSEIRKNESLEILLYYLESNKKVLNFSKKENRLEGLKLLGLKSKFNEDTLMPMDFYVDYQILR